MAHEVLVGLIAGGSAVVASVGAQIISATVSARQEKRRLAFERHRLQDQEDTAKKVRFEDAKREHFVEYLYAADILINCAKPELLLHGWRRNLAIISARQASRDSFQSLMKAGHHLKLLVPELTGNIDAMQDLFEQVASRPPYDEWYPRIVEAGMTLRNQVQENLGIAAPPVRDNLGIAPQ